MFKLYDYQQKLVDETRNNLKKHQGVLIVSPPGSGKSVVIAEIARLTTQRRKRVLFFVHRKELIDQITATFAAMGVDLDLCTILTVGKVKNRLDELPKPDLIITDEAQHARAKTYLDIFEHWSDVFRIGFSGSPWRMNGQGYEDIYPVAVYGPQVGWLIDHQKLAPFKFYAPQTLVGFKKSRGEFTKQSIDEVLGDKIYGDAVKSYQQYGNDGKAILYAHSVEFSKRYAQAFNDAGISACHVDSKTPAKERERLLIGFKNGAIKVLCNVNLVSEGFNVPDCQVIIMCRPTASLVLYLQQAMRSMRYLPDKQAVIIDHVGNYVRFGLPDLDRQWSLTGKKRKNDVEAPDIHSCPECYQVFYEWENNRCPYCGAEKPVTEADRIQAQKEVEAAKMIEIANRTVTNDDTLLSLYERFNARKTMHVGNVHRPINAAVREYVRRHGVHIRPELNQFAQQIGKKPQYIYRIFSYARKGMK